MKITIDIPAKTLRETIKHTGAKTGLAAVIIAFNEFIRWRRREELAKRLHGSCPDFISKAELKRMREDHKIIPIVKKTR